MATSSAPNTAPTAAGNGISPPPPTPPAPVVRQRDPPTFSGVDAHDVHDWLDEFDRVCRHNRWDNASKLNNVAFYLSSVAKTWFLNHENEFQDWNQFAQKFRDLFGRPASRKLDAEQSLCSRVQRPEEPYTSFIEDILSLCKRCNPEMSDAEKIRYILKGIREDAFQLLVGKGFTTVSEVLAFCKTLQDARNLRNRETYVQYTTGIEAVTLDTLRTLIREIVREEVSRHASNSHTTPNERPSLVQSLVQEEIASAMAQHSSVPLQPSYADIVRSTMPTRPSVAALSQEEPRYPARQPISPPVPPLSQFRRRLACYYCGIPGHTIRVCRRRQRDEVWAGRTTVYATQPPYRDNNFGREDDRSALRFQDRYYYSTPQNETPGIGFRGGNGDYFPARRRSRSPGARRRSQSNSPARLQSPPPRGNP